MIVQVKLIGERRVAVVTQMSRGFRVLYHHMPLNTVPVLRTHITKCALVDFLAFSVNDFTNKAFGRSLGDLTKAPFASRRLVTCKEVGSVSLSHNITFIGIHAIECVRPDSIYA